MKTPNKPYAIQRARIEWRDGAPYSIDSGDRYHSRDGCIEESRYVFLQANNLNERWRNVASFTIGEIGFGFGLNFLVTLNEWIQTPEPKPRLHFVSFESTPPSLTDIQRFYSEFPELQTLSKYLDQVFDVVLPGFHRFIFFEGRVSLTVAFGPADQLVPQLRGTVDAWYLDGFAPDRNPELWSLNLCSEIANHSRRSTTFATFSSARIVRESLEAAHFTTEKIPGFGKKRESLRGILNIDPPVTTLEPWYAPPQHYKEPGTAIVIGAGVAGFWTSYSLIQRGWKVHLLESGTQCASGASGNPRGLIIPYIARNKNLMTELYLPAFLFAIRTLKNSEQIATLAEWLQTGTIQLSSNERLERLAADVPHLGLPQEIVEVIDAAQHEHAIGFCVDRLTLRYPYAGSLNPSALCCNAETLLGSALSLSLNSQVNTIELVSGEWVAQTLNSTISGDIVILANSYDAARFSQSHWIPLEPVRGEIAYAQQSNTDHAQKLPIAYDGYTIPPTKPGANFMIGADYSHADFEVELRAETQRLLLERASHRIPTLGKLTSCGGRVAFRASTHHRLPYVGGVPDLHFYSDEYKELPRGFPPSRYQTGRYYNGLFISAGYGSRGLLSSPLCAEQLTSIIAGEPLPLPAQISNALNPASYLIRELNAGRTISIRSL